MNERIGEGLWLALASAGDRLAAIIPGLVIMIVLVLLGLALGGIARAVITRVGSALGLDGYLERMNFAPSLRRSGVLRRPSELLGRLAFWTVFVVFASLGIDALASPGSPGATAFLVAFLPPLFAAVLIMIVGWLVANFLSQGLLIAAVNAGLPEARLLARAVHWGVVLFAGAMALTHLGIGKEMVLVAFGILFGGLVFAVALALGLGGRTIAAELLARRLRRESPPERERLTHL
jgi:hypothetical protein